MTILLPGGDVIFSIRWDLVISANFKSFLTNIVRVRKENFAVGYLLKDI